MNLALARAVADAVLYEGYLLYPYRSTSRKNQVRWQFGVLGPPGAQEASVGEDSSLAVQCLLRADSGRSLAPPSVRVFVRFLQLQVRGVERADSAGGFSPVAELRVGRTRHLSWDEAVEREVALGSFQLADLTGGVPRRIEVEGGVDIEPIPVEPIPVEPIPVEPVHQDAGGDSATIAGRLVRRREPLAAEVSLSAVSVDGLVRLAVEVRNCGPDPRGSKDAAIRSSFIGLHLLLVAEAAEFVSLLDPPEEAVKAAAACRQHRCWPVLAGVAGQRDVVLASPIILYDYPAVAAESAGALFDSTEIDEILTLRILTLTEEEKAAARATDAQAAAIIDRCEQLTPEEMQRLHGALREPHFSPGLPSSAPPVIGWGDRLDSVNGLPWWDPAADESVRPDLDSVMVGGARLSKGSLVRVRPTRRADAQDLFYAGQSARVTAVNRDVDGETHVAVVLVDDPAADLHDWYGRYLYFAPDELEPLDSGHNDSGSLGQEG